MWEKPYGITHEGEGRNGDNISDLFPPFLKEASRVLVEGGIVLAKLADIIHNHRYQWHQVDFINAARSEGMTPCDMMIKLSKESGRLQSSLWDNVYYLRRAHAYWIVVRNADYDERKSR